MFTDVLLQVLRLLPLIFPSLRILRSHWLQVVKTNFELQDLDSGPDN